mmetsp:Transcript_5190/g.9271  ORF Transcript_5190/g.9271 Transcript_5190/m.9271 type:complete len:87 (+) Transcript_5190:339-599(+)
MSIKKHIKLLISTLQHAQYLPLFPGVQSETFDEAAVHAQSAMFAAALQAESDAVRYGCPGGRASVTIVTAGIARECVQKMEACGGE